MSIFQKFKELAGIDYEEPIEEEDLEEKKLVPEENTPARPLAAAAAKPVQPVAKPAGQTSRFTNKDLKLVVMEPQSFDESPRLVDSLKARKPVIINLENLETDVARKIFDFLSGATYALNGNVQKVANNIFVFAPENVDVSYNMGMKSSEQQQKSPWK